MEWITDNLGIGPETQEKLLWSFLVVAGLLLLRWAILRGIRRRYADPDVRYLAGKITAYVATIIIIVTLAWIWIDAFDNLGTFLGLATAGVAIALADLLKNMAGWGYIVTRRPFWVGDRIEVAGTRGDVVDVRLFRFTMLEVGNWVHADQSTGRLVHVPNGVLFTEQAYNYTEGFPYVWHEIEVLVTFESDWRRASEILEEALQDHGPDLMKDRREIEATASKYQIKLGTITPIVYTSVKDSGVLLTGRLLIPARTRRAIDHDVWRAVLDGFAAEDHVDLAYPTTRTYLHSPIEIARPQEPFPG